MISGSIFHIKFDFLSLFGSSLLQTYTSFAEPFIVFTNTGVQITVRTQLNFIHLQPKKIISLFVHSMEPFIVIQRTTHFHLDQILLRRVHYRGSKVRGQKRCSKTHLMFTNLDDHLGTSRQFMSSYKTKRCMKTQLSAFSPFVYSLH